MGNWSNYAMSWIDECAPKALQHDYETLMCLVLQIQKAKQRYNFSVYSKASPTEIEDKHNKLKELQQEYTNLHKDVMKKRKGYKCGWEKK
jgi:hypothetical protein